MQKVVYWNTKIVQWGKIIEVYEYYDRVFKENFKRKKKKVVEDVEAQQLSVWDEGVRLRDHWLRSEWSARRCKKNLSRLVTANFSDRKHVSFLTLTYKQNMQDLPQAMVHFKAFIRRIRRISPSMKYIGVPEFQKRGAVHFHVVLSCGYIPNEYMCASWNHGSWDFHSLYRDRRGNRIASVVAYITKYMEKGIMDSRLSGKKAYFTSRGLVRAVIEKWLGRALDFVNILDMHSLYTVEHLHKFAGRFKMQVFELNI